MGVNLDFLMIVVWSFVYLIVNYLFVWVLREIVFWDVYRVYLDLIVYWSVIKIVLMIFVRGFLGNVWLDVD